MNQPILQEQMSQYIECIRSIETLYDEYAKSMGLTYTAYNVLNAIYETPKNCTQKRICELTYLPKQTVNAIIRTLWEQGYVEMKEIDADRRNKEIRLSKSGQMYAKKIFSKAIKAEEIAMLTLTCGERQNLIDYTKRVECSLKSSLRMS
jgi:DNA-binding MarR family transcriptional regulator